MIVGTAARPEPAGSLHSSPATLPRPAALGVFHARAVRLVGLVAQLVEARGVVVDAAQQSGKRVLYEPRGEDDPLEYR